MRASRTKYEEVCQNCNIAFLTIPSKKRRFCSQGCYQEHERPVQNLFWNKVAVTEPNECWMWLASPGPHGYGEFRSRELGHTTANRISYTLTNGIIPVDMVVCHNCDNPGCVNPKHLFLGTKSQNTQDMLAKGRGYWQQKTHCPSGHEYTEANTKTGKRGNGAVFRVCVECSRAHARKTAAKKRAKLKAMSNDNT